MAKNSQQDKKETAKRKAKGQTPINAQKQPDTRSVKKQSAEPNDV